MKQSQNRGLYGTTDFAKNQHFEEAWQRNNVLYCESESLYDDISVNFPCNMLQMTHDIFNCIFFKQKMRILIPTSLKFISLMIWFKILLVQVMAWCRVALWRTASGDAVLDRSI